MKRIVFCVLCTVLVGCSASSRVSGRERLQVLPAVPAQYAVIVNYRGGDADSDRFINDMKANLIARLMGNGLVKGIGTESSCEKKIEINLDKVEYVTGFQRVMWGVIAGRNRLNGQVNIIDCKTGQPILKFRAEGESASHPFSGEAGSDAAVSSFTQCIIDEMKG